MFEMQIIHLTDHILLLHYRFSLHDGALIFSYLTCFRFCCDCSFSWQSRYAWNNYASEYRVSPVFRFGVCRLISSPHMNDKVLI